ncbi:TldD/PmbA family protein [Mucilaginibacter myungsuensis]|uniref:TldD/PmbA family protein n=1 Tax=Mucilaginibacter myungsuensis TaxID=649104 RepID=A0A929PXM0_9SPHI|nr:TldD/PmbA family protein [Mucilaginibacter myungsuensis]MBE9662540.1 TldD/PmbA family protein [Mucilaginibacter myungsuensis]MDN3597959.1 TldD/PmbA family protein [Mucilaginibacter myungsuensis]
MKRRDFIFLSGLGASAMMLPDLSAFGRSIDPQQLLDPIDIKTKKMLADIALNSAKTLGASYADVRIGRYLSQNVSTREQRVQNVSNSESFGVGIRVIANGCWGFAATNDVTKDGMAKTAARAVAVAKANAKIGGKPVDLAPQKGYGEVSWKAPIEKNAFEVPIKEKVELLLAANAIAMKGGANFVNSGISTINEQKYFASTDGSYIDQDIHRISPNFSVTKSDPTTGEFQTQSALSSPMGLGFEYLTPSESEKVKGIVTRYKQRYDILEDIAQATRNVGEKLKSKSVEPGKYDLVLDPSHLWLTIHESVGHPTELDRVLGYEANFAGTSFVSLDKVKSGTFKYGSEHVNIHADKLQKGSLGAVGYDDEGVKCGEWEIIKDGILVGLQATRDQAKVMGLSASQGCCYADGWDSVQFQRMPNVSLKPGKTPMSPDDMIKNVEKGIFIVNNGSFSIDQQRYNFQFGGQLFYEIKNGKIVGQVNDVAYQANTREFWNSCTGVCDEKDYRLGGSFSDGKGQPQQVSAVSHGSSTARFNGVNVINTKKKIG